MIKHLFLDRLGQPVWDRLTHRVADPPDAVTTRAMPPHLSGQGTDACRHGISIVFEGRPSPPEGVP